MAGLRMGEYQAFLVDLDGVLVRGGEPLPGAAEALQNLKKIGRVVIFSNNSTRSRREFAERLQGWGFKVEPGEIVNSAYVVARRLLKLAGPSSAFTVSERGLQEELKLAGHRLVVPEEAQFLVVGMERKLTYGKLAQALRALLKGARFIAANADQTFPTSQGLLPGAGAVVGAIEGMGFPPEEVVGKPSPIAFKVAMEAAGVSDPGACLLVGDRLETDILGARQMGMDSVLVLTGVTTREEIERSRLQPSSIAESLAELVGIRPG